MSKLLGLVLIALALAGCQHAAPPVAQGCVIPAYPLTFSNEPGVLEGDTSHLVAGLPPAPAGPGQNFGDVISDTLGSAEPENRRAMTPTDQRQVLVLSGGSLHGAFGAGFFSGLRPVPTYKIVTAVSTGALQSTFVFFANRDEPTLDPNDPGRRTFPPYMGMAPAIGRPGRSNLGDLELAYAISKEGNLMKVSSLGYVGAALNGSIATFKPLKATLEGLISGATLKEVAEEARDGRKLFVGVSNLDNGKGYALDLTAMVLDAYNSDPSSYAALDQVRDCYIDALLASASVPPGVPPISLTVDTDPKGTHRIETHMFMDGGARFGVFFQQVHDGSARPRAAGQSPIPTDITLIVNGTLYGDPWTDSHGKTITRWSVVSFGLRAVDLLENQVYRFSVDDIEKWALPNGTLRMAFISNQGLPKGTETPDQHVFRNSDGETRQCGAFRQEDQAASHPQEFDPQYMQCLVDYGRSRGGAANPWNKVVPKAPAVSG